MTLEAVHRFIEDQRKAKQLLAEELGIPEDIPAVTWSYYYGEILDVYERNPFADHFFPHGLGLAIKVDDLSIDFDFSMNGLPDGFDPWRLARHMSENATGSDDREWPSYQEATEWVNQLVAEGKAVRLDNLFYLTESCEQAA